MPIPKEHMDEVLSMYDNEVENANLCMTLARDFFEPLKKKFKTIKNYRDKHPSVFGLVGAKVVKSTKIDLVINYDYRPRNAVNVKIVIEQGGYAGMFEPEWNDNTEMKEVSVILTKSELTLPKASTDLHNFIAKFYDEYTRANQSKS